MLKSSLLAPIERFFAIEAASGIILLVVTPAALVWANSPWPASYDALWHLTVSPGFLGHPAPTTVHFWINEGLMTIFFLVVGLDIRREMHDGALSSLRQAVVPIAAAAGGIVVPALLFLAIARGDELQRGRAIPTATDIAFAIDVLAVLGKHMPSGVRVLLLALAILDDIAPILLIAFFYSSCLNPSGLAIAVAGVAGALIFQRLGLPSLWAYVPAGAVIWGGLLSAAKLAVLCLPVSPGWCLGGSFCSDPTPVRGGDFAIGICPGDLAQRRA